MGARRLVRVAYVKKDGNVREGSTTCAESNIDASRFTLPLERVQGGLHGWGVAEGLQVRATRGESRLRLSPGVAIDPEGRHLPVADEGSVAVGPNPVPVAADGVVISVAKLTSEKDGVLPLTLTYQETWADERLERTPLVMLGKPSGTGRAPVVLATVTLSAGLVTGLSAQGRQGLGPTLERLTVHRMGATEQTDELGVNAAPAGELRPLSGGGLELDTPVLSTTGRLGVGSPAPRSPVGIRGTGPAEELLSFESSAGQTTWHVNQSFGGRAGLNIAETGVANGRLYIEAGGHVGVNTTEPKNPLHVSGNEGIRQNSLYLSGGAGGSSFSYNAHRNATNGAWVFPNPTRPAVTVEMDDYGGKGRFEVYSTTTGNKTTFVQRLRVDGETGEVTVPGQLLARGGARGSGVTVGAHGEGVQYSNAYETVGVSDPSYNLRLQSPNWIVLHTAGSERLSVDPTGNVKIQKELTVGPLVVVGDARCWTLDIGGVGKPESNSARIGGNLVVNCWGWPEKEKKLPSWSGGGVLSWDIFARGGLFVGNPDTPPIKLYNNGTLQATKKEFSIPHPLDTNRRLEHGCVEGPEQAVTYRGRAVLHDGCAEVRLPVYFEALTRAEDRTVQLTPVLSQEGVCSALGASTVRDGRFTVRTLDGGATGGEFCWQVTAIRADIEPLVAEPEPAAGGAVAAPASPTGAPAW